MGAPMKKTTTAKAMTKGAIAEAIAASCELKKSVCAKALNVLAEVATQEVKKTGVFALPGLQIENAYEACYKGREAGSIWQGCDGQSEASQKDREGVPSRSLEGKHLSRYLPLYI